MRPLAIQMLATWAIAVGVSAMHTAYAQTSPPTPALVKTVATSNSFIKKRYSIKGEWSIIEVDNRTQILFSENFKTKGGPDLKVFLSKSSIDNLDSVTAAREARSIGVLKSKSGEQVYALPEDLDISEYKSVIIHCESFSVLWGGFNLPQAMIVHP